MANPIFPSSVDETKPAAGAATTQSMRDNFAFIKNEIETLGNQAFGPLSLKGICNNPQGGAFEYCLAGQFLAIPWETFEGLEAYDPLGAYDPLNNTLITIPAGIQFARFTAQFYFAMSDLPAPGADVSFQLRRANGPNIGLADNMATVSVNLVARGSPYYATLTTGIFPVTPGEEFVYVLGNNHPTITVAYQGDEAWRVVEFF